MYEALKAKFAPDKAALRNALMSTLTTSKVPSHLVESIPAGLPNGGGWGVTAGESENTLSPDQPGANNKLGKLLEMIRKEIRTGRH